MNHLAPIYPILDVEMAAARGHDLIACARGFTGLGLEVQQLRAKKIPGRDFLALAKQLVRVVPQLIINDRADIALLAGAAGVHLGQTDLPLAAVRRIVPSAGPGLRTGVSTHNLEQMQAALADRPDYVAIGPVYVTSSKSNPDPVVGLDGVRAARAALPMGTPLVAIGGIARQHCAAVRRAGADSLAVISALWCSPDPVAAARELLLASA